MKTYPDNADFKAVKFETPPKENPALEFAALFDTLLIALMFTLIGSSFITAPGFGIGLAPNLAETFSLPQTSPEEKLSGVPVDETVCVLNIRGNSMMIFDGRIYSLDGFAQAMKDFKGSGTLLVKMDKAVDAQTFLKVCQLAKAAGFERAQLAAKPAEY